ncbi:MAG: protein kinase [Thaumarchaeota archaeon 13_1_40CM_3_50_5]|nr:MAG: protein kinase [Thaumarchaeota archaeon 13_1_40CM_3_50_5]
MEHPSQVRKDRIDKTPVFPHPSKLHTAKVMLKLLPVVISLRRDRREWVKREGKNVDEEKYRRHARRALKTFIDLGPSYIKLGQWLSTRVDILPQPYLEVLAKLQDDVPPARFDEIRPIIEGEQGKVEDAFEEFDTAPLSGASLGQVYVAKYSGHQVMVKVGRPNIEKMIEDDIYVLKKQFIETVHEEMDYRIEAQNLLTIRHNLAGDPSVVVPDVFMERTSRHVLTMEYVPGIKITDIARLDEKGIDREKLVVRAHRLFFKMLLRHDIFHADPHPGNISVADDGRLILYDFGMVGRLDNETRIRLIRLYLGLLDKDAERTVNVLIELGTLEPTVNRYIVERGIALSIRSMHGSEVDRMEVKSLVDLANKTMSRFPFRLPKNLALYMRMASILEGIYQHHKVPFKFVKVLANLLEEEGLVRDAYIEEVKVYAKGFVKGIQDSVTVAPLLKTYLETVGSYGRQERNTSTLAASILASALFVGSAVILPYNSYLAYGGFAAAAAAVAVVLKKKF